MTSGGTINKGDKAGGSGQGTPTTSKLADLLLGMKDREDAAVEIIETDVALEAPESCNCRKSRCLKL